MIDLNLYEPILNFLASFLGHDTELLLCDTEKILLVFNSQDPSHTVNAPLSDMQKSFLTNPDCKKIPHTVNYRAMTSAQEKLRSATMFIYEEDEIVGFFTINAKVTNLLMVRDIINTLINGEMSQQNHSDPPQKPTEYYETLTLSVSRIIDSVISDSARRFKASPDRFTADEKLLTMREMDKRGVFLVKGSVSEVAAKLKSSEATIYRYLHQINS